MTLLGLKYILELSGSIINLIKILELKKSNSKSMKIKIITIFLLMAFFTPFLYANAADSKVVFKINTQSDSGDYIGQNKSWDFSDTNNSKIAISKASDNEVNFNLSSFDISDMSLGFASEQGKKLMPGLYSPAKRLPFRDSYNGINISGDGRGCNTILGAFYVHEYVVNNGVLEKAAIDFLQICEPKSSDINQQLPKLVGSLRYNSNLPDSCNSQGCAEARKNLGLMPLNTPADGSTVPDRPGLDTANTPDAQVNEYKQSIVKIKSYELSPYNELKEIAEGSGVIISAGGIILTNDHVISTRSEIDNSLYEASYQVCLVKEVNKEPSCDYLAKVIARNEDKDLALLQIVAYPGGNALVQFKPLILSSSDLTNINDQVTAAGFPAIGEGTITVTSGIVSGKTEKYGNQWIKTDAVVSYGSSGGAALNKAGEVIGITTQVYSDLSGDLGYILSVNSINDWVATNINRNAENSRLFNRLADLTKKQKILQKSNLYINLYPSFSFTKPSDWTFIHNSEDNVAVLNKNNQSGAYVSVSMIKAPYELSLKSIKARLSRFFNENSLLGLIKFTKEKEVNIGGVKAKQITLMVGKKMMNSYAFTLNNYLVTVEYGYGQNDQDKKIVDNIIKSIQTKKISPNYLEARSYKNNLPKFSINTNNDWAVLAINNKAEPLNIYSKKINEAYVTFHLEKMSEDEAGLSDDEFINMQKDQVNLMNQQMKVADYKYEIVKTAKGVKLNNQIKAVQIDGIEKNANQNKILAFDRDYFVKLGKFRLTLNLTVYSDNKAIYNKSLLEFNKLLTGLKLN